MKADVLFVICLNNQEWFAGVWPRKWKKYPIAAKELFPIFVAVAMWESEWAEKVVLIHTDNHSIVPVLNKLYSKDTHLAQMIQPIARCCMRSNILLRAGHIAGTENTAADMLSRQMVEKFLTTFPNAKRLPLNIPSNMLPQHWL